MSDKSLTTASNGTVVPSAAAGQVTPVSRYAELLATADVVDGYALVDQVALLDVPFIVVGATARDGVPHGDKKNPTLTNYWSFELITADRATLLRYVEMGRLDADRARRIEPCEALVTNDGSTGMARQLVAYLHGKGLIIVPDGPNDGPMGESRWDLHRSKWLKGYTGTPVDGKYPDVSFKNLALSCPRGLRVSEYTNDWTGDKGAATFYLA